MSTGLRLYTNTNFNAFGHVKDYEAITPTAAEPADYALFDAFLPFDAQQQHHQHQHQNQNQHQHQHQHQSAAMMHQQQQQIHHQQQYGHPVYQQQQPSVQHPYHYPAPQHPSSTIYTGNYVHPRQSVPHHAAQYSVDSLQSIAGSDASANNPNPTPAAPSAGYSYRTYPNTTTAKPAKSASEGGDPGFSSASDTTSTGPGTPPSRASPGVVDVVDLHDYSHSHPIEVPVVAAIHASQSGASSAYAHTGAVYGNYQPQAINPAYNSFYAGTANNCASPQNGTPINSGYGYSSGNPNAGVHAQIYGDMSGAPGVAAVTNRSPGTTPQLPSYAHMHDSGDELNTLPNRIPSNASSPATALYSSGDESQTDSMNSFNTHRSGSFATNGQSNGAPAKVRTGAGRKATGEKEKKFVCSYPGCSRAFSRNFNLSTHYNTHLGVKPFECPHCPKSFSRRHDCARHVAAVHATESKEAACRNCTCKSHSTTSCTAGAGSQETSTAGSSPAKVHNNNQYNANMDGVYSTSYSVVKSEEE